MSWSYLQLANRVLRRLNEVPLTASTFGAAVGFQQTVLDSINDTLNDIYDAELRWPFLWASTTQNTTPYVQSYALPTNFTEINWNSFYRQGNILTTQDHPIQPLKLSFISYQDWQDKKKADEENIIDYWVHVLGSTGSGSGGAPELVFPYEDRLHFGLSTVPDNVGNSADQTYYVIYYEYYFKPTDLSLSTDLIVIPDQWSKVIVDGAMYYANQFRDNIEEAQGWQQKFNQGIVTMRTRLINKEDYMMSDQINRSTTSSSISAY